MKKKKKVKVWGGATYTIPPKENNTRQE